MDEQIKFIMAAKYAVAQMMGKGSSGFMSANPDTGEYFHVTWSVVFDYLDDQIEMKTGWENVGGAE